MAKSNEIKKSQKLAISSLVLGILAIFTLPLGIILGPLATTLGIIALVKRTGKKKAIFGIILGFFGLLIGLLSALLGWIIIEEAIEKNFFEYQAMVRSATESDQLVQRGKEIGLSRIDQVPVYRIDQADMFDAETRDGVTLIEGCHETEHCVVKGIFIRNGLEGSDLDAMLAHEYMHTVWFLDDLKDDKTLAKDLKTIYNTVPEMQSISLKYYDKDQHVADEVLAYSCTDATDKHLTKYVLDTCNQYIDRSQIQLLY